MANSLQRSITFCQTFTQVRPYTGIGNFAAAPLEPALSIGDWVRQFMLSAPFAWRWNRNHTSFAVHPAVSSTVNTSGTAVTWTAGGVFITGTGWVGLSVNINGLYYTVASVTDNHHLVLVTGAGVQTGVTQTVGGQDYVVALSDFGWPEKAAITDGSTFSKELVINPDLAQDVASGETANISPVADDGSGNITLRLMPPPSGIWTVQLDYQKAPLSFAAMADPWTPIPDYLSYVYNQGCLYLCYEMGTSELLTQAFQIFLRNLIAVNNGLTDSQINLFMADRIATQREVQQRLGPRTPQPQQ